jgi:protein-tyrosine phosphatase
MVDIHCHILPGLDDGSESWEMTREMCGVAASDGITHIVATPHCNYEFAYDRNRFGDMLGELHDAAVGKLDFSLGCDFNFCSENIEDALVNPKQFAIGDSQYMLVELPEVFAPSVAMEDLLKISSCGMVPIITHPERNRTIVNKPEIALKMVEQGCLMQVTASAFTGFWSERPKKVAEWLLKRGAVHVIASDGHDPVGRPPVMSQGREAIEKLAGREAAEALSVHNPTAIINDEKLAYNATLR